MAKFTVEDFKAPGILDFQEGEEIVELKDNCGYYINKESAPCYVVFTNRRIIVCRERMEKKGLFKKVAVPSKIVGIPYDKIATLSRFKVGSDDGFIKVTAIGGKDDQFEAFKVHGENIVPVMNRIIELSGRDDIKTNRSY